jgi:hypothetical protein
MRDGLGTDGNRSVTDEGLIGNELSANRVSTKGSGAWAVMRNAQTLKG